MQNDLCTLIWGGGADSVTPRGVGIEPWVGVKDYISYRNAGPRRKSMVTIYEMTGGYAASRAAPQGGRVSVAYRRNRARRSAPGFLLCG
jgi:hypothetical protein